MRHVDQVWAGARAGTRGASVRKVWRLAAAITIAAGVVAATAGPATAAPSGSLSGIVTDTLGNPIANLCVTTESGSSTSTAPDGTFTIGSLPSGSYKVQFNCASDQSWVGQWYQGQPSASSASPVPVTDGQDTPNVNAQLTAAASISGTVNGTSGPAGNICVNLARPNGNGWDTVGGALTAPDGSYTFGGLSSGEVRVQFLDCNNTGHYVEQWWNNKTEFDNADAIVLNAGEHRSAVDATLQAGGLISGHVRGPSNVDLPNICVNAVVNDRSSAGTQTDSNGNYTLDHVPAGTVTVVFQDCNGTGPYSTVWWNGTDQSGANPVSVNVGVTTPGIDAELTRASVIAGHVTNSGGAGLENICVSVTTATAIGGGARTDSNGDYQVQLAASGTFKVQFVDCNQPAKYAGQWWNGQSSAATATPLAVGPGKIVKNVNAVLAKGKPASISGKVTNLAGVAMTTACALAFVPNEGGAVSKVDTDGTYVLKGLGSGTYFVAFFDCQDGGPVVDPTTGQLTYASVWWPNVPVFPAGQNQAPDPIAQGAVAITVTPGQALTGIDHCFGCGAIVITSLHASGDSIQIVFSDALLKTDIAGKSTGVVRALGGPAVSAASTVQARAAVPAVLTYTATCTSTDGGVPGTASGATSPITVSGLTVGKTYSCVVTASDGRTTVASSQPVTAVLVDSSGAVVVPVDPATSAASMARTGPTGVLALFQLGLTVLGVGTALTIAARRRRRGAISV